MLSQLYPLIKPIPIFQAEYLTPSTHNGCTFEYPSWDNFSDLSLDSGNSVNDTLLNFVLSMCASQVQLLTVTHYIQYMG